MGITNLRYGLEQRLSHLRGELETAREEVRSIEAGVARLSPLHHQIAGLEEAIRAVETAIRYDNPDWQSEKVKAVKARVWKSPFRSGEIGRTALSVLRESGDWMRPIDVARAMLESIGADADDRLAREKLTNSVAAYFKAHEGDLVEARGEYAKEWRVIR